MSTNQQVPDYGLDDVHVVTSSQELKAMFDPFRSILLQLLLDRAATIHELAVATRRPKGTVAYHVRVLTAAGMVKVVRTRRIRGQQERFYGRTARLFSVGEINPEQVSLIPNAMPQWAADTTLAHEADQLRAIRRYAWISEEHANAFWDRVLLLVREFSELPSVDNGEAHAFMAAIYPTTQAPRLPDPEE
ncbi:ArsR/SmtB family transcription factor [Microlunatus soli]|uniref:Helix-turn-helix domain-containing protein n=1 Tax=Microlunatus soli TaxID=630515 RepID=A0A1H1R638_9ACTN|nr:winged helix-turn-helix domain-containing protein [Microlunatus soli]SDS31075.1 Helix-turn-helix domain-containing protein [Microlunatus soli]